MLYDKPSMNVCCRETFIFLGLKIKTPGIMSNSQLLMSEHFVQTNKKQYKEKVT